MKNNKILTIMFVFVTVVFVAQAASYFSIIRDLRDKWDAVLYERQASSLFGTDSRGMPDAISGLTISDSRLVLSNALGLNVEGVSSLTATDAYEYVPLVWNGSNYYIVAVATN